MTLRKTEQGRAEIATRSGALTAVQRRLLIVIDGKKTVNDLGSLVRVGELEDALEHLLHEHMIEPVSGLVPLQEPAAPGFAAPAANEAPRAATSPEEFMKVRAQVSGFVFEKLGEDGQPICDAVDRCDNPAELRKLLRGIEIFVGQRLDAQTTQDFARHFGALLL